MLHADPGAAEKIQKLLPPEHVEEIVGLEPAPAPPRWTADVEFNGREFTGKLHYVGECIHDEAGEIIGYLFFYGPSLPARTLGLLTRGDANMFERMASLAEPGRRQAAILFAALDDSTALSRRLPSAVYFNLIRRLVADMDEVVVARRGLVGKHTGDGVTAFFLADDHGSRSAAARLAIETAPRDREGRRERRPFDRRRPAARAGRVATERRDPLGVDGLHRADRDRWAARGGGAGRRVQRGVAVAADG